MFNLLEHYPIQAYCLITLAALAVPWVVAWVHRLSGRHKL